MLLKSLLLLLLLAVGTALNEPFGGGPDLCVIQTPLVTRHFRAWRQGKPATVRGCWNGPPAKPSQEIHVIRMMNAASGTGTVDVTLEVVDATGQDENGNGEYPQLVLVLDAPHAAVRWNIRSTGGTGSSKHFNNRSLQHSVIVTGESELSSSDLWVTVKTRPSSSTSRDRLIKYAEERFKTPIHSLSQIDRSSGVNRVRLTIRGNETSPIANYTLCDNEAFMTSQPSPIVEAWRTGETQPTEGCFHSDHAGTYSKDVHVIELDDSVVDSLNDSVHIHLTTEGQVEDETSRRSRNVVLVLKTSRPTQWILSSSPVLAGSLMVMAENPSTILDAGISGQQKLEKRLVDPNSLPNSFALLILSVTADLGPPVSYVKTSPGTRYIELVINKKLQSRSLGVKPQHVDGGGALSGAASHSLPSMEMGVRSLDRSPTPNGNNRGNVPNSSQRSINWTLQQHVRVQCVQNHMTASLPRPVSDALGVTGMHLSDRNCNGKPNATHWIIRSPVTSCGSTSKIDAKLTTYSNMIYVMLGNAHFGDGEEVESSEGSNTARYVIIPIQCHSELSSPMGFEKVTDDDNVMDTVDLPVGQVELYQMDIFRNKELTKPVVLGNSINGNKAEVVFDETLFVRTYIDGVSYIRIVMEKCWVSNTSDSDYPPRLILIRNTCPADLSVQIRDTREDSSEGFSFHVSKDYGDMGQLYVHCKLGLCTKDARRAQGNLRMCVDSSQYCTGRHVLKPFLDETISTAQQVLVRGPFRMVTKFSPVSNQRISGETTTPSTTPSTVPPNTPIVVIGVPTEVTVGIGMASFLIGVTLTAMLWCIHMRTDPYRRVLKRKGRSGRNSVNNRCPGAMKGNSPVNRVRGGGNESGENAFPQCQQQHLVPSDEPDGRIRQSCTSPPPSQYQFSYEYEVSPSQSQHSASGGSHCSSGREDSSPTPNSQTPIKVVR